MLSLSSSTTAAKPTASGNKSNKNVPTPEPPQIDVQNLPEIVGMLLQIGRPTSPDRVDVKMIRQYLAKEQGIECSIPTIVSLAKEAKRIFQMNSPWTCKQASTPESGYDGDSDLESEPETPEELYEQLEVLNASALELNAMLLRGQIREPLELWNTQKIFIYVHDAGTHSEEESWWNFTFNENLERTQITVRIETSVYNYYRNGQLNGRQRFTCCNCKYLKTGKKGKKPRSDLYFDGIHLHGKNTMIHNCTPLTPEAVAWDQQRKYALLTYWDSQLRLMQLKQMKQ